ncbi:universal stress protein [Pirellulales bacterium]|nr:universal stress protein [Pirellulales bacterium]
MNWFERKKIVVPVDFSEHSHRAVDEALEMVFHPEDVHVLHIGQSLAAMAPESIWQDFSDETQKKHLEQFMQQEFGNDKYAHITQHVSIGDPGHKIAEYAEEVGAEVIVMPSHGRTGIKRLFLGSVAERVLRLAKCPVLVLKNG